MSKRDIATLQALTPAAPTDIMPPQQSLPIKPRPEEVNSDGKKVSGKIGIREIPAEKKSSTENDTQKKQFIDKVTDRGEAETDFQEGSVRPRNPEGIPEVSGLSDEDIGKTNAFGKESLSSIGMALLDLGTVYLEQGKIDEAILEFENVIERNPQHLESRVKLGAAYGLKGMANKARAELKKAIESDLDKAIVMIVHNIFPPGKLSNEKIDEAMAHINLGKAYKEEGKLELAKLEYEKALKLKPEQVNARKVLIEIYYKLGTAYMKDERYDNAVAVFEKVLEVNPDFPHLKDDLEKAYVNLGISYAKNKELDKAILEFKKIININPDYARLDSSVLDVVGKDTEDLKVNDGDSMGKESHRKKAANINRKGMGIDKAISGTREESAHEQTIKSEMVDNGVANMPNQKLLPEKERVGSTQSIAEESKKEDFGIEVKEEVSLEKVVDVKDRYEKRDKLERNGEKSDKAKGKGSSPVNGFAEDTEDSVDGKVILKTETVSDANYKVTSYYITGNYKTEMEHNEAIKKYENIIRRNPYDNNAHHNLAYAYYSKALHLDDAIAEKKSAAEGNKGVIIIRFYIYDTAGNDDMDEINYARQQIEAEEKDNKMLLHVKLGNLYNKKGLLDEAIHEYKEALEIDPKHSRTVYNLAFCFLKKGSQLDILLHGKKK